MIEKKSPSMIIERTIKEIPPMQGLEKQVAETAKTVESWKSNVKAIEAQIQNAHSRLEKSEAHRKRFALDASLGNTAAITEITKARAEHAAASGDIQDLATALGEANTRLIDAEGEAKAARSNLAKFAAEILQRQRIDLAGQIDTVIADFARLYGEYSKLGAEIVNMPDVLPLNLHGMSNAEGAAGARRIRAAVPKLLEQVFQSAAHDEQKKEPLATTEARFWNLAPVETTAKAA
ncbi:MAG TPA: hypothetical protein VIJ35_27770 [Bradyrhizobium sp.]|jgi:DNA repair exonuclease SbcCD ATPase subunit